MFSGPYPTNHYNRPHFTVSGANGNTKVRGTQDSQSWTNFNHKTTENNRKNALVAIGVRNVGTARNLWQPFGFNHNNTQQGMKWLLLILIVSMSIPMNPQTQMATPIHTATAKSMSLTDLWFSCAWSAAQTCNQVQLPGSLVFYWQSFYLLFLITNQDEYSTTDHHYKNCLFSPAC